MQKNNWTSNEVTQLKQAVSEKKSVREIAKFLGRTVESVRGRLKNIDAPTIPDVSATTLGEDLQVKDSAYWEREYRALNGKYSELLKQASAADRLVSEIRTLAPKSYCVRPGVPTVRKTSDRPQSAVLEFSDTHIGAVVAPDQTLTFGEYNFPVFLARLKCLETAVISIATDHITTPVPELVIAMLGDMLDGALEHSNECGQVNPLFNQFFLGAHAVAQFIRNVSEHFPKVRIFDVVGNHTRFQNQRKMPTKNKYSNFDKFFYALVRELLRDIKRIEWPFHPQPYQTFEVNGFTFFAGHGETLRGGDKALGIPNHAVGRLVSTTTQLFNKYGKHAPNYYLLGHLHRNISLPHATGDVIINGGFVGVDNYGLDGMFTPADPMQKLFFVHPHYGKTATYDITLKHAKVGKDLPYNLPGEFEII